MKKLSKKSVKQLVQNHNRRVARNNKVFEKLSPADKRVAIARDVLAQIAAKKLVPTAGAWLTGKDDTPLFNEKDLKKDPELQSILAKTEQCEGCALGGLFMCAVKRADQLKLSELDGVKSFKKEKAEYEDVDMTIDHSVINTDDAFRYLKRFFSDVQLNEIESAFEKGKGAVMNFVVARFAEEVNDPADRMRLIMENIITHKGKFVYQDEPFMKWVTPGFVG